MATEKGTKLRKRAFFDLVRRFRKATDPKEIVRLGNELGRVLFGKKI
jgi:hypothetical protein